MTQSKADSKSRLKMDTQPKLALETEVIETLNKEAFNEEVIRDVVEDTQDFNLQHIEAAEHTMKRFIELNEVAYKGNKRVAENLYKSYVSNINNTFSGAKALTSAPDIAMFYKTIADNTIDTLNKMMMQYQSFSALSEQAIKDTTDASYLAYRESFLAKR